MSYEIIPSTSFCSAKVLCPKSFVANNRAALHRGCADYLQVHCLEADLHLLQFLRFVVDYLVQDGGIGVLDLAAQ